MFVKGQSIMGGHAKSNQSQMDKVNRNVDGAIKISRRPLVIIFIEVAKSFATPRGKQLISVADPFTTF